jgi:hypothetical protein
LIRLRRVSVSGRRYSIRCKGFEDFYASKYDGLSRLLYCIASAMCLGSMSSLPTRSSIVLATFNILSYALVLSPSFVIACFTKSSRALSAWHDFLIPSINSPVPTRLCGNSILPHCHSHEACHHETGDWESALLGSRFHGNDRHGGVICSLSTYEHAEREMFPQRSLRGTNP